MFDPAGQYTFANIEIGDDVFIGTGAILSATIARIEIGNKVMLGPRVMMFTGNHNVSVVGRYMMDVSAKRPEDDQPIKIESDVWIGAGTIVLKGVTVGRGSIVAAGSLINKNVPPNSIVGGVPARKLRNRFPDEVLKEHISLLYGEDSCE